MDARIHLALAGIALCDALDDGATDSVVRIEAVETARKAANAVLARGQRQTGNETEKGQ